MDELNTNTSQNSDQELNGDSTIENLHPVNPDLEDTEDDGTPKRKHMSLNQAEAEVGADEPTQIPPNLNIEDEEAWKEESIS